MFSKVLTLNSLFFLSLSIPDLHLDWVLSFGLAPSHGQYSKWVLQRFTKLFTAFGVLGNSKNHLQPSLDIQGMNCYFSPFVWNNSTFADQQENKLKSLPAVHESQKCGISSSYGRIRDNKENNEQWFKGWRKCFYKSKSSTKANTGFLFVLWHLTFCVCQHIPQKALETVTVSSTMNYCSHLSAMTFTKAKHHQYLKLTN